MSCWRTPSCLITSSLRTTSPPDGDGADRQLVVVRRADLAHGHHVEVAAEAVGDGGGDGHAAAGQPEDDGNRSPRLGRHGESRSASTRPGVGTIADTVGLLRPHVSIGDHLRAADASTEVSFGSE